jgi:hypothetical protein
MENYTPEESGEPGAPPKRKRRLTIVQIAAVLTAINLAILVFLLTQGRGLAAAPATDVLRAQAIELVGDNGQVRARLNVEPDGVAVFRLMDSSGTIRVKLGASEEGSGLVLLNELTQPGIHLLADADETSLTVTGQDGAQQVLEP